MKKPTTIEKLDLKLKELEALNQIADFVIKIIRIIGYSILVLVAVMIIFGSLTKIEPNQLFSILLDLIILIC